MLRPGLVILTLLAAALAACGPADEVIADASALEDDAITVGSFDFAESRLLGEIYGQALEAAGYDVQRAIDLGPRELVAPALAAGLVEFVPEYSGSALRFHRLGVETPSFDPVTTHGLLAEILEAEGVTALTPAPAQNANAFVVTRSTADQLGLRTISDLAPVADDLTFGGPPECATRVLCLLGLEETYGVTFGTVVALDAGGPMTHQALLDGGVDVALLFSSDPSLAGHDFVELVDDRELQPAENITPLVRTEVVERWGPALISVIDSVSSRLTDSELRRLNGELDSDSDIAVAAARWLREQDLA